MRVLIIFVLSKIINNDLYKNRYKTKQAKKFVELIETMPFAKILDEPNSTTKDALESTKKGLTTKHKNAKELAAFLNKQSMF